MREIQAATISLTLAAISIVGLAAPVYAVDGVIEINQAKALVGGVTAGDGPGYPVGISEPGSYRLTSDLVVTAGIDGVVIGADNVTLDLNGFTIFGSGEVGLNDGISIIASDNVEVRNGTVRGFLRHGVFSLTATRSRAIGVRAIGNNANGLNLEGNALVDGCVALDNGIFGIRVGAGSLVINSVARSNTDVGLALSSPSGYRSNVLTENNGGNANPQTTGGIEIGSNVCGNDTTCP